MKKKPQDDNIFKQCSACKTVWKTRKEMLDDRDVFLIGYQAHFADLKLGLFMFNHKCGGTMGIKAENFIDLYNGPVFDKRLTGTEECPGHCLHKENLERCPLKCECAYVRELLQILKNKEYVQLKKGNNG